MKYRDINIDFNVVETGDPRTFLVADNSYWRELEDKPSIIEVVLPGSSDSVVNYYTKNGFNNFNSVNLNQNCMVTDCNDIELLDLPDGVYCVTVKGSPSTFYKTKHFLRSTRFKLRLKKTFLRLFSDSCKECNEEKIKEILDIKFLLEMAECLVMDGEFKEAQEVFYEAQRELDKITNCKGC